jgi:hypothetical protein
MQTTVVQAVAGPAIIFVIVSIAHPYLRTQELLSLIDEV